MSLNENMPLKKYYLNTPTKLSKTSYYFNSPTSSNEDELLFFKNILPTNINKKKDEIYYLFNLKFEKSFLYLKLRALITFENQLKKCISSPNNIILNHIP